MAVRDHSLDDKIIDSARTEFLAHGYKSASINKIARNAGVTTGALYIRYTNKDDLFASLVQDALDELVRREKTAADMYYQVRSRKDLELFLLAMEEEMHIYVDVIFRYYDQCVLLFCKSQGSSVWNMLQKGMEHKARTTVEFLETLSHKKLTGVELLIRQQADLIRLILDSGYDREQTMDAMNRLYAFNRAGWRELFEKELG